MAKDSNSNLKKLDRLNLPKHIVKHCMGNKHTEVHHRVAGAFVMIIGVGIAQGGHVFDLHALRFIADITGYFVHGIGSIPFVVYFERMVNRAD